MIFLYIIFCISYQSFTEKIETQTYSGHPGDKLEIFTPNNPFLATISYIDSSKTTIEVSSPLQSTPLSISSNRAFYFPKGKSKFIIYFKEQSSIIFNYASIPEGMCSDGISIIVNETFELNININSSSFVDKCYFYAFASTKHRFMVIENKLDSDSSLCAFNELINGNPYQCYQKGNPVYPSFIPTSGSFSPWMLRYTAKSQSLDKKGSIKISLQAPAITSISSDLTSFIGSPFKYDEPPIGKYHKKWWIPVIGSIAPTFLLIAWIYTLLHLLKKRNSTIV